MKCRICGKNAESEYCFKHKPRKKIYPKIASKEVLVKMCEDIFEMRSFFAYLWSKNPHFSEISLAYLGSEPLTTFFHHILPKDKYKEARLDEENIIFVTLDEHTNVESDMYRYEIINEKRKKLLAKYGY